MTANVKRSQKRPGANAFARISCCAAFALTAAAAARAHSDADIGLRDGESLTYSVRWEFIPSVGRIKISADALGTGSEQVLRVTTTTSTWGLARGIFPFDGRGESVYTFPAGRLISTSEWSAYRNKQIKNSVTFDYDRGVAIYTDDIQPSKTRAMPMPKGDPSDLILALIQTRCWNLKLGEKRDALVIFEDQFYPLTIHAEETDFVVTSIGFFRTLVLVPRMEKTPPIGMFKRGSTVRVWLETDDARHLPVRFEVAFRYGVGTATIMDYKPPK